MELVTRMLDGSISYDARESSLRGAATRFFVAQDDKIERLQKVPMLQGCTRKQLRAVAKITGVVQVPAGRVLTRAGEPGNEFYLILDGAARVEVSPRKQLKLGPGDFFGEMSLLDGGPRSATVVAETDLRLLVISRQNFSTLLSEVPELTRNLLTTLSKRVRQAEQSLHA